MAHNNKEFHKERSSSSSSMYKYLQLMYRCCVCVCIAVDCVRIGPVVKPETPVDFFSFQLFFSFFLSFLSPSRFLSLSTESL